MVAKQYLKGRSVFTVSLVVIGITALIVYLTGIPSQRSVTENFLISLTLIGVALFIFMAQGLYRGIGLVDNFPSYKKFKPGDIFTNTGSIPEVSSDVGGDGIEGIVGAILWWIAMTIFFVIFLFFLEALLWLSIFIFVAMLYWVFFRALKLVFSKASVTRGRLGLSVGYSIAYTALYIGWLFGLTFIVERIN